MEITISKVQAKSPITVMRLDGNLDSISADQFDNKLAELINEGTSDLVIDLSEVKFLSSAGIRSINESFYALHPYDKQEFKEKISPGIRKGTYTAPHLKLVNPSKQVRKTLTMVGIDMYIEIFDTEKDAINSFTAG